MIHQARVLEQTLYTTLAAEEKLRIVCRADWRRTHEGGGGDLLRTVVTSAPHDPPVKVIDAALTADWLSEPLKAEIRSRLVERFGGHRSNFRIYRFHSEVTYADGTAGFDSLTIEDTNAVVEVSDEAAVQTYMGGRFSSVSGVEDVDRIKAEFGFLFE
ncbi:MAG: hypothetical protein ACR2OZ_20715 [Verrucomicrobiales bacterium]